MIESMDGEGQFLYCGEGQCTDGLAAAVPAHYDLLNGAVDCLDGSCFVVFQTSAGSHFVDLPTREELVHIRHDVADIGRIISDLVMVDLTIFMLMIAWGISRVVRASLR